MIAAIIKISWVLVAGGVFHAKILGVAALAYAACLTALHFGIRAYVRSKVGTQKRAFDYVGEGIFGFLLTVIVATTTTALIFLVPWPCLFVLVPVIGGCCIVIFNTWKEFTDDLDTLKRFAAEESEKSAFEDLRRQEREERERMRREEEDLKREAEEARRKSNAGARQRQQAPPRQPPRRPHRNQPEIDKLRRRLDAVEAVLKRPGTPGEAKAAEVARRKLLERIADLSKAA